MVLKDLNMLGNSFYQHPKKSNHIFHLMWVKFVMHYQLIEKYFFGMMIFQNIYFEFQLIHRFFQSFE